MEDLAVKLQEVKDRSLRNEGRIKQLEVDQRALNELALSVKELATDQTNMKEDIGEIKANVRSLTAVPSKRWEKRRGADDRDRRGRVHGVAFDRGRGMRDIKGSTSEEIRMIKAIQRSVGRWTTAGSETRL